MEGRSRKVTLPSLSCSCLAKTFLSDVSPRPVRTTKGKSDQGGWALTQFAMVERALACRASSTTTLAAAPLLSSSHNLLTSAHVHVGQPASCKSLDAISASRPCGARIKIRSEFRPAKGISSLSAEEHRCRLVCLAGCPESALREIQERDRYS